MIFAELTDGHKVFEVKVFKTETEFNIEKDNAYIASDGDVFWVRESNTIELIEQFEQNLRYYEYALVNLHSKEVNNAEKDYKKSKEKVIERVILLENFVGCPDKNDEKKHYLPCCTCGDLQLVKDNVISIECDDCYNIENDDYETNMLRKG